MSDTVNGVDIAYRIDGPGGAAHLSNIEEPEAFNGAVRAFIDRVDDRLPKIR